VFNLVLDSLHAIEIGGEVCATLGHGISDDAVAAHEYFGTDKVLTFLALLLQKYLLY
jgi:acyl carrier protein